MFDEAAIVRSKDNALALRLQIVDRLRNVAHYPHAAQLLLTVRKKNGKVEPDKRMEALAKK